MTEIAAAMGLVNLEEVERIMEINRRNYDLYKICLEDVPHLSLLGFDQAERNNFQYVVVEVGEDSPVSRDGLVEALHAENVLARKYFWPGCHRMKPFRDLQHNTELPLPVTAAVADRVVVLPTGTTVSNDDVRMIVDIFRVLFRRGK
jgi:dTDP-4-amino-4,6-dideoxygalactose transaminase